MRRIPAFALAILAAVTICALILPDTAHAGAKKQTVYLVNDAVQDGTIDKLDIKYNSKGQVVYKDESWGWISYKAYLTYSGDKVKTLKIVEPAETNNITVSYKNGRAVKGASDQGWYYTMGYDKKGRVHQVYSTKNRVTSTISYNSKGQVVKVIGTKNTSASDGPAAGPEVFRLTFAYDKKGYVKKYTEKLPNQSARVIEEHNAYNKAGRLFERATIVNSGGAADPVILDFGYKKMKVAKKYVKRIKAEQKSLLNHNFDLRVPYYWTLVEQQWYL